MKIWIIVLLVIFIGCSIDKPGEIREIATSPVVYFCPQDDCGEILTELILSAEESVHCALFDLRLKNVINALGSKSYSADVKIVVDGDHYGHIVGPGVRKDTASQFSHNKFCVIDDEIVTTGSFNPTERGSNENNNNLVVVHSLTLAQNYENEFMELWNRTFGEGSPVKNPTVILNGNRYESYFCPEDDCKERIIDLINEANESVYFMAFSFTDEELADALLFNEDIEIRGVFENVQAGSSYSQYQRFRDFGIDVRKDSNPAFMHHKVFIIDEKTVVTGSANPSGSGFYRNDENILIMHDEGIAQEFVQEFFRISS